jgi:hypothetical protein
MRPQGHADLTKLLRLRAREIRPGGHLLMVTPTSPASTVKLYWEALLLAFKSCLEDGTVSQAQWRAFRAPFFQPTDEDLRQVLSTVQDLWHVPMPWGCPTLPHPAWTTLQDSRKTRQDYEEYANGITGFFMALIYDVLMRALRGAEGTKLECPAAAEEAILQQIKKRFKEAILSESLRHKCPESSWLVVRLLRKAGARASNSKAKL